MKSFWKNIHFGRVVIWCGMKRMIIHFSKASVTPSDRFANHPFLHILVLNLYCAMQLNQFLPPASSYDLCLLFCLILLP